MASINTLATNVNVALAALLGPRTTVSDMRTNLESLAAGTTKYRLTVNLLTDIEHGSNVTWHVAEFIVYVEHELASPTGERTYTEGAMWVDQASLVSPAWWRAIVGVAEVVQDPELQDGSERSGNTVRYSYGVSLSFTG
jgi:hypothetical protein